METKKKFDKKVIMSTVAESEAFFNESLGNLEDKSEIQEEIIESFDYASWQNIHESSYICIGENAQKKKRADLAEKIYSIFTNQRIRNGPIKNFEITKSYFLNAFQEFIDNDEPIKVVIPSFPFKLPNPLRNNSKQAGFSEIAAITQLDGICKAINYIYEPGAQFLIASDGILYAELFGVSKETAINYREGIKNIIKNLEANISVLDIIDDLVCNLKDEWNETYAKHSSELRKNWESLRKKPEVAELARNSKRNLDLTKLIGEDFVPKHGNSSREEFDYFYEVVYGKNQHNDPKRDIIDEAIEDFTVGYLALNYTLRELQVLEKFFPKYLRGTVHPKQGQLGLHLVNKKTQPVPWAGMGVIKCNGNSGKGFTRVRFWYDIAREPERYVVLKLKGTDQILGYKELNNST